ncbi:unnamed protein product, partial [Callosobruchus maculatus]
PKTYWTGRENNSSVWRQISANYGDLLLLLVGVVYLL